jgi:hypothetical protein
MEEEKEAQMDFNVFVGAETGILKGINVNRKTNICKNFHNIKSLDKVTQPNPLVWLLFQHLD